MAEAAIRLRDAFSEQKHVAREDAHRLYLLVKDFESSKGRCTELDGDAQRFANRVMDIVFDLDAEPSGPRGEYRFRLQPE